MQDKLIDSLTNEKVILCNENKALKKIELRKEMQPIFYTMYEKLNLDLLLIHCDVHVA